MNEQYFELKIRVRGVPEDGAHIRFASRFCDNLLDSVAALLSAQLCGYQVSTGEGTWKIELQETDEQGKTLERGIEINSAGVEIK